MDRAKQIRSEILGKFFKDNGRMPTEKELSDLLFKQSEYGPVSKPMVPLYSAKSLAEYTREDLLSIIKDRSLIDELLTATSDEIARVEYSSNAEALNILTKAELILTDHQSNTFKNIYDNPALIPGEADVANWYITAQGVDDLYVEDDGTSSEPSYMAQWIELNSFNVESGKEGISISPSTSSKLPVSISIAPYAAKDYALLETLNEKDPISIVASGLPEVAKGIELEIPINDRRISVVKLDTNSITCSVLVDDTQLFTKSLDGPTTLSIGTHVNDHIKIRLYSTTTQVNVVVRDLSVFTTGETATGNYDYGQYVSLQLPIDKKYGNLLFNPDEYVPTGTSIDWYWSNNRLVWYPMSQLDNGKYALTKPDDTIWNTTHKDITTSIGGTLGIDDDHGFKEVATIVSDTKVLDYSIKEGKGCVLFVHKDNPNSKNPYGFQFTGFIFYLDVLDDTGYTLELANPYTNTGQSIFSNISIESADSSLSEVAQTSIQFELPKGIHKVELQLAESIVFNFDEQADGYGTGFESPDNNFQYGITKRLENEYGAIINWTLGADRLGREADVWIEPYGVDEYDPHIAAVNRHFIFSGTAKLEGISAAGSLVNPTEEDNIRTNITRLFTKKLTVGKTYEVVPVNEEIYTESIEAHSGYEVHYYSGDGTSDWEVDMYHLPLADVTLNENATAYTPAGYTVTVPNSELSTTLESRKEFLQYSGDEANISFTLENEPTGSTFSLDRHNLVDNVDLDPVEGIDENFLSFWPKGRAIQTFTSDGNVMQTTTLTYRPILGYCLVNEIYDQSIIQSADCDSANGTWVSGFCTNGESTTETDCLAAGSCVGYETVSGTVDEIQPTDKAVCEATPNGGTAGSWVSTSSWTRYIMVTSQDEVYEYDIQGYDFSTGILTVTGLNGTSGNTIKVFYEYGENQSTQTQFKHVQNHEITATNEVILLDREIYDPNNTLVKVVAPGDVTGVDIAPTLDAGLNRYTVDLSGYSSGTDPLAVGDIVTLQYLIEPTVSVDGSTLNINNIPNPSTSRLINKEYGNTLNPTAETTLTMEHPVAFREAPGGDSGPNSNLYIEINGTRADGYCTGFDTDGDGTPDESQPTTKVTCETDPDGGGAGTAGTWTDIVQSIDGNVLTMDLSQYAATDDSVQEVVNLMVIYESYEHQYPWKLEVSYDYYKEEGYSFNYTYNQNRWAAPSEIWNNDVMRDYFFDISYRETIGDDLYIKATLTSDTGVESPIIRRLRFEQ